ANLSWRVSLSFSLSGVAYWTDMTRRCYPRPMSAREKGRTGAAVAGGLPLTRSTPGLFAPWFARPAHGGCIRPAGRALLPSIVRALGRGASRGLGPGNLPAGHVAGLIESG